MESSKSNDDSSSSRRQDDVTQSKSPARRLWSLLQWFYLQYLLHFGVYVLEPWELAIFNCVLVAVLLLALYTTFLLLPGHVIMLSRFLFRLPDDVSTSTSSSSGNDVQSSSGLSVTS